MPKYYGGGGSGSAAIKFLEDENGNIFSARTIFATHWLNLLDQGTLSDIRFHARMPRMRVRAISATNQTVTGLRSRNFDGLSGATLLQLGDVIGACGQTNPAETAFYRVATISGANCTLIKLSLLDPVFANGFYVDVQEGNTAGGQTWKFIGDASFANARQMPDVTPSIIDFVNVAIEDFVITGDNTSESTGDWQPIIARMEQAQIHAPGSCSFFSQGTYRCTSRINRASLCVFIGQGRWESTSATTHSARMLFDGCGGYFGPAAGETYDGVTYDSGWRAGVNLERMSNVFVNGSSDMHYGALIHGASNISYCNFFSPFGNGIEWNTADIVGGIGNCNGDTCYNTLVNAAGLNGFLARGGDANNIAMRDCRSTGHGTRGITAIEYDAVNGLPSLTPANNPALTLNAALRQNNSSSAAFTPTISGQLSWGPTLVPRIVVEINSVAGGTGLGQAFFRISYDGGSTWGLAGAGGQATGAGPIALDGAATGMFISFPVAVYSTAMAWHGSIFPGNDWGLRNESFLGGGVDNCEFTSTVTGGGIYDQGTFTVYTKPYTEGGTKSDITTATVVGGNLALRPGGNATKLPKFSVISSNAYAMSGVVCDDGTNGRIGFGEGSTLREISGSGDSTRYSLKLGGGGVTGLIVEGYSTTNQSADRFKSRSGNAFGIGVNNQGTLRGLWLGTDHRFFKIARANLPSTGVPLTGGAGSFTDGAWPVDSFVFEKVSGLAALGYRVFSNSLSPSYNLVWMAVANPSPTPVSLPSGNQTVSITTGGLLRVVTSAGAMTITVSGTGALMNDAINWEVDSVPDPVTIDGIVVPANTRARGKTEFASSVSWKSQFWVCL